MKGKYELFYFDELVAVIDVNDNNYLNYKYINCSRDDVLVFLKKDKSCEIKEFPFLENRLQQMKQFNLNILQYVNSNYVLKKIT